MAICEECGWHGPWSGPCCPGCAEREKFVGSDGVGVTVHVFPDDDDKWWCELLWTGPDQGDGHLERYPIAPATGPFLTANEAESRGVDDAEEFCGERGVKYD